MHFTLVILYIKLLIIGIKEASPSQIQFDGNNNIFGTSMNTRIGILLIYYITILYYIIIYTIASIFLCTT